MCESWEIKNWKDRQYTQWGIACLLWGPHVGFTGDIGWVGTGVRCNVEMCHYWNRLMQMESLGITKKILTQNLHQIRS